MLGFRVWDSYHKTFDYDYYVDKDLIAYEWREEGMNERPECIPLQSTGVTDWQGKTIFEGDVLFIYYHEKGLDNSYYLVNNVREFLLFYGSRMLIIRKIACDGNIYEHPALLERLKENPPVRSEA